MQENTIINFRRVYNNPNTGTCTWELQNMNEHFQILSNIVRKENWGEDILNVARKGRINVKKRFTFQSGVGYDVVDWDLLGGDSQGMRTRVLEEKYRVFVNKV